MEKLRNFCQRNEKTIGSIASVLAVIMFVALIEVFISNMRGQSNIIIQPLATSVNGFFWSLYAFGRKDWFLFFPNVLALVLGFVTVLSALV